MLSTPLYVYICQSVHLYYLGLRLSSMKTVLILYEIEFILLFYVNLLPSELIQTYIKSVFVFLL